MSKAARQVIIGALLVCGYVFAGVATPRADPLFVESGTQQGMGFVILPGILATSAHVVSGVAIGDEVVVRDSTDHRLPSARLLARSALLDLALLDVPTAGNAESEVLRKAPEGLEVTLAVGLPAKGRAGRLSGLVVGHAALPGIGPGIVVAVKGVRRGHSGAPVRDRHNQFLGMLSAVGYVPVVTASAFAPANARAEANQAFVLGAEALDAEVRALLSQ